MHSQLEIQYGGLQGDFDNLKAQLDEEAEGAAALKTQLQKSQAEYQTLKSKYDKEISARTDEIDELRSVVPHDKNPCDKTPLYDKKQGVLSQAPVLPCGVYACIVWTTC